MIYMGSGGSWSPDCPLIDVMIGQRLQARGFAGTRDERICLYGSTIKEQALEYARNGDEAHLKVLELQQGCVVSWVPSMRDMLLHFGNHLSELHWNGTTQYQGVNFGALVRDIAGDIDIAETYLRFGRQKRAIGAMIDSFLEPLVIMEHVVDDTTDLDAVLGGHVGEVWVTGPCVVHDFEAAAHEAPHPAPERAGMRL
ncbi:hypothetical protein [Rhizobium sp. BK176]|uniref:hypothetical protein n=1 Tax=Rhizobium sp. BK176 TaxID=2587071 RepID=UPI0021681D07|nr:hypothetical protein [Rhizobium sp. BK176]MCS4089323.1 hypothetical protein [Rhizobium sp. BK176]